MSNEAPFSCLFVFLLPLKKESFPPDLFLLFIISYVHFEDISASSPIQSTLLISHFTLHLFLILFFFLISFSPWLLLFFRHLENKEDFILTCAMDIYLLDKLENRKRDKRLVRSTLLIHF